jgi:hypothetical protein
MKRILTTVALLAATIASAQAAATTGTSTSNANQSSASTAASTNAGNAQNITFNSTAPADTHLSETVRNVSAPGIGAYGSGFSQYNCGNTMQGYVAGPGFSVGAGGAKELYSCVMLMASNELMKQSTVETDTAARAKIIQAATNVKCMVNNDIYVAMVAAGMVCEVKPRDHDDSKDNEVKVGAQPAQLTYKTAQVN